MTLLIFSRETAQSILYKQDINLEKYKYTMVYLSSYVTIPSPIIQTEKCFNQRLHWCNKSSLIFTCYFTPFKRVSDFPICERISIN